MAFTTLHHHPLSRERVARLFRLCRTPGAASNASARIHALAAHHQREANALLALSGAMNEHRHALLQRGRGNEEEAAKHTRRAWTHLASLIGGGS